MGRSNTSSCISTKAPIYSTISPWLSSLNLGKAMLLNCEMNIERTRSWLVQVSHVLHALDTMSWHGLTMWCTRFCYGSGYSDGLLLWARRTAQYLGHWSIGSKSWRHVWHLWTTFLYQNSGYACQTNGNYYPPCFIIPSLLARVSLLLTWGTHLVGPRADHPWKELDLSRYQARQLFDRQARHQNGQSDIHGRLWHG